MKLDTPRLIVFAVAFASIAVPVGLGKVESKYLEMALIWQAAQVDGKILAPKAAVESQE